MMRPTPENYLYSKEHEWVDVHGDTATIGVTDYAQHSLGDLVYVDLPKVGQTITAGASFAVVESVKAASEVYAPISGTVVEVNTQLSQTPEAVNQTPYTTGWIAKVKWATHPKDAGLMDHAAYDAFIAKLKG